MPPKNHSQRAVSHVAALQERLPSSAKQTIWGARQAARRGLRIAALRPGRRSEAEGRREELSVRYLRGDGIEIGALHRPLWVPHAERVRYVDFLSRADLLETWSETYGRAEAVVETTIIDDGERLDSFADGSVDFVIANHLIEHAEDPVGALESWARVLRADGIMFVTVPDARHTFDRQRRRTTVEHLLRDHREGPQVSREEHFEEYARLVEHLPDEQVAERVTQFNDELPRLHFHAWELEGFLELVNALELELQLEVAQAVRPEFSVVLRKA